MGSRTASNSFRLVALLAGLLALAGGGAAHAKAVSICLVEAAPGLGEATIDVDAARGLRALERSGVDARIETPATPDAYRASLAACAHPALTIGVGLSMSASLDAAAVAAPQSRFALVGASVDTLPHRPGNVVGLVFRSDQAGYLAGYVAGLWAKLHHAGAVGAVGGIETPRLDTLLAGFAFGATQADAHVGTLHSFSDSFTKPAACRARAQAQIVKGARVLFEAAGGCNAGTAAAVEAAGAVAVGLDDPGPARSWQLTSVRERAGVVVARGLAALQTGSLPWGRDLRFGAQADALGFGAWSARVPLSLRLAAAAQLKRLAAGRAPAIPTHLG